MNTYENLEARVEKMVREERRSGTPKAASVYDVFLNVVAKMPHVVPSIKVPCWNQFNELTGGLRPREFTILCGATGKGKTTWLASLSSRLISIQVPHVVFSVETGAEDFVRRILSCIDGRDHNTGEAASIEDTERVSRDCARPMKESKAYHFLYENRIPHLTLLADLLYANETLGCKVAMIDNLNFFLEVTTSQNERLEMDRVVHDLIIFTKKIDMHVIMVMHPRKNNDTGRVESEFDVKGSSTAVQEAHNVLLLNIPREEDQSQYHPHNHREIKIAKLRRRGSGIGKRIFLVNRNADYEEVESNGGAKRNFGNHARAVEGVPGWND